MGIGPETQRTAATTLRTTSRPAVAGVSWATWIIGGAAVIVVLSAGALLLGQPPTEAPVLDAERVEASPPEEAQQIELTTRGPLDLSALHLDAQERARIWNESAVLSGISLVIENAAPIAHVDFEFGVPSHDATPGAELTRQRHVIAYEKGEVMSKTEDISRRRVALTPPNCTLDAAYRALMQTGVRSDSRIGVMLIHSEKHRRPVWLMTTSDGNAYNINAESCVLLRR